MSKYKSETIKMTAGAALEQAGDIIRELAEEMGNWRDNMSGTSLENTGKFEQVDAAASELECFDYDPSELSEEASETECTVTLQVPRSKRQNASRAVRLANAVSMMQTAAGAIEDKVSLLEQEKSDLPDEPSDGEDATDYNRREEIEALISDMEDQVQQIEDAASNMEGVEFPGMFG